MVQRGTPRNPAALLTGVCAAVGLSAYVNIVPPESIAAILVFFALCAGVCFFLGVYVLRSPRDAALYTCGTLLFPALRALGLKHPLYGIMLLASVIAVRFLWKQ